MHSAVLAKPMEQCVLLVCNKLVFYLIPVIPVKSSAGCIQAYKHSPKLDIIAIKQGVKVCYTYGH